MGPVLSKIQFFSLATFLKRGHIGYQDITPSERPRICSRMMMLGKCFEGCNREHTTIPDSWAKKVVEKLGPVIQETCNGTETRHQDGRSGGR